MGAHRNLPRAVGAGIHPVPVRRGQPGRRSDHASAAHGGRACARCGAALRAGQGLGAGSRAGDGRRWLQPAEPRTRLDPCGPLPGGVRLINCRGLQRRLPGSIPEQLMFDAKMTIGDFDPELQRALDGERRRQDEHLELIASENYASPRVLQAQGSVLTNKYAEGYPGKRYYGGCEFVDIAEQLAIDRAKKLFGAAYANVQPHSGSQANAAVYLALLKPGDTLLGMSLAHGGHLTHGAKVNFSGKLFNAVQYGLDPATGEIDYAEVERLAREHRPKMIIAGFSAYSRVVDFPRFRKI